MNLGNLENGLILLVMGMGFVLTFLVILICSMGIMSKFVGYLNKVFPEAVEEVKTTVKKASSGVEDAIAVALAAIMSKRS
mgnify:FL=1